jgi:hypothetical protein
MPYVNKVPGRPLRGQFLQGMKKGEAFASPRLTATVALWVPLERRASP